MAPTVWHGLFAMAVVLVVLLVVSFPYLEPGTGSYALAVASFVILGVLLAALAVVIRSGWDPFGG